MAQTKTRLTKKKGTVLLFVATSILLVVAASQVSALEKLIRFKACSVEELSQQIHGFCRQYGYKRDTTGDSPSGSLNAYGSVALEELPSNGGSKLYEQNDQKIEEARLKKLVEDARKTSAIRFKQPLQNVPTLKELQAMMYKPAMNVEKRSPRALGEVNNDSGLCSYISECCQDSCVIESEKLLSYCA